VHCSHYYFGGFVHYYILGIADYLHYYAVDFDHLDILEIGDYSHYLLVDFDFDKDSDYLHFYLNFVGSVHYNHFLDVDYFVEDSPDLDGYFEVFRLDLHFVLYYS